MPGMCCILRDSNDSPHVRYLQVARGLLEVHSHDVVHRDLKPDNILVNDTLSEVAIADFGLSASYTSTLSCSRSVPAGMQSGTLPYMAPEQLNGKARGSFFPSTCCVTIAQFASSLAFPYRPKLSLTPPAAVLSAVVWAGGP